MSTIKIPILNTSDLPLPSYQSEGAACFDFVAANADPIAVEPGKRAMIPTGIHMALPVGYELQVRGRSGLAAKHGIGIAQGIGTVDSDYRGEIFVILVNHGEEQFVVNHGDRVAQGMVTAYNQVAWDPVDELDQTARGSGGFGSTGKS